MMVSGRDFLLGGGTRVITDPAEARAELQRAVDIASGKVPATEALAPTTGAITTSGGWKSFEAKQEEARRQAKLKAQAQEKARLDAQKLAQQLQAKAQAKRLLAIKSQVLINQKRAKEQQIQQEMKRINTLKQKILNQGGTVRTQQTFKAGTNQQLVTQTIINPRTNERVFITKNLATGDTITRTFERKNGKVVQTGKVQEKTLIESKQDFTKLNKEISDVKNRIKNTDTSTLRGRDLVKALNLKLNRLESQKKKGVMTGYVTSVEAPTGNVSKLVNDLEKLQRQASTASVRKKEKDIKNELKLYGLTVADTIVKNIAGIILLPNTLVNLAKNPRNILKIPSSLKQSAEEFGQLLIISPTEAFAKVSGEILFLKGSGEAFKVVGKVKTNIANRINPKFVKVTNNKLTIKTSKGKTTLRVGGSVKKIQESLSKQAKLAGEKVTAVSVQADRLINFIRRNRTVRKPIPGEADFSVAIKKLLKKYDKGTITKKELITLEKNVPILERSFFADPRGRFRPSRLGGKERDASLLDILSGDFTFRSPKPQILLFEDVKVAKFPPELNDIKKALRANKPLTESQAKRLLKFQTQVSGEFKPIGFLSKEPEITLAKGEIIRRVKKIGTTRINGKNVEIVLADVKKATESTRKLLLKGEKGKLTNSELKTLRRNLKKETGFDSRLSYSSKPKPVLRFPKRVPRVSRKAKVISRKVTKRGAAKRKVAKRKVVSRKVTKRGTAKRKVAKRKVAKRKVVSRKPITRRRVTPPIRRTGVSSKKRLRVSTIDERLQKRTLTKSQPSFYVKIKKGGRVVNLYQRPLTLKDAKNLLAYSVDNKLIRSGWFEPLGKTKSVAKLPDRMTGYFNRVSKKLRPFKIRVGVKKQIRNGYIEKRKYLIDTPGEKRELKRIRKTKTIKRNRSTKKKTIKKRIVRKKR